MTVSPLDPEDEHPEERPAPRAGAGAIPLSLRVCWWGLVGCDAVMAAAVVGLAGEFGSRLLLAGLPGPVFSAGILLFVGWWHAHGPGRRLWRTASGDWARGGQSLATREDDGTE
jgi:hypothetical protein